MYIMKRYQIYLNPHSISVLDDIERMSNISRSKIIRELIDRFVDQISKAIAKKEDAPVKLTYFDQLIGAIDLKTSKPTNYALDDDEIYLKD